MSDPESYDELESELKRGYGLWRCKMRALKSIDGAGRLDTGVVARIASELKQRDILHSPERLPTYQDEWVSLWLRDSFVGAIVADVESGLSRGTVRDLAKALAELQATAAKAANWAKPWTVRE